MKIKKLVKEIGFDSSEFIGTWKEWNVYVATSKVTMHVGLPQFILSDNLNDARWATPEETIELMYSFCV